MLTAGSQIDSDLQLAVQHHQSGQFKEAERLYRRILSSEPAHADALHLLGVLASQAQNAGSAVRLIRAAIAVRPDFPDAFRNLGRIFADNGKMSDAVDCYRQLTVLRPRDADAFHALGVALRMSLLLEEAIACFAQAISLNPKHADALTELGGLLRLRGRHEEAASALSIAADLRPHLPDAWNNLALALADAGSFNQAESAFQRAIAMDPAKPQFLLGLGQLFRMQNKPDVALSVISRAVDAHADFAPAYIARAGVLADLNRPDDALADYRTALALAPQDAGAHLEMSKTMMATGDLIGAEASCEAALHIDPRSASAWECLGMTYRAAGRFDEAVTALRRSLELEPKPRVNLVLGMMIQNAGQAEMNQLTKLFFEPGLADLDRVHAGFALGKILDEAERYDEAFSIYEKSNQLFRKMSALHNVVFDFEALRRSVDLAIEEFSPAFFRERAHWVGDSQLPVFVVGMPRSGTTLVEQIAASHSRVFGAGELSSVFGIRSQLARKGGNGSAFSWDQTEIAYWSLSMLDKLTQLGGQAERVIDKMPGNVLNLGLIAALFPGARVILCQRDARDTCLSCWFQYFGKNLPFSYDLADCGLQYVEQERLTAHWKTVLPLRMLFMQYEELVVDLETQSRRLIDFLGLNWEPSCLAFHKTQRPILTKSVWQVRQPIYTRSVGRWKHYEKHIDPLLKVLTDGAVRLEQA